MQIGIFGAGAIGSFLGTRLSASGQAVRLLARANVVEVADELRATDRGGTTVHAKNLTASEDPEVLRGVDICLVTVKSQDTPEVARALAELLGPEALVVSFQNGLDNARRLGAAVSGTAVQGIVTYNVYRETAAETRQATSGKLVVGKAPGARAKLTFLVDALRQAGETVEVAEDIDGEVAGKLLINLNNGVCAATGLRIADSLGNRKARWCFAECIAEGSRVFARAGIRPISPFALPLPIIARTLKLPNAVVMRVARGLASVAPTAKSSTLQDLERGRTTEIADLNGAIVRLAGDHNVPCPANRTVVDAVRAHEASVLENLPIHFVKPAALKARIRTR